MKARAVTAVLAALSVSGCISLSRQEQTTLRELKAVGIADTDQQVKHPGAAGALNILPGFGNFYLAAGTDEGSQWTYGFLNLLFWPISVVWAVPQAAVDANTLNKRETIYYYTVDPQGKEQLARLRFDAQQPEMTLAAVVPSLPSPSVHSGPVPPPPPAFLPGKAARTKVAATLHQRSGETEALPSGAEVLLVSSRADMGTTWWWVKTASREGWVLQTELESL